MFYLASLRFIDNFPNEAYLSDAEKTFLISQRFTLEVQDICNF